MTTLNGSEKRKQIITAIYAKILCQETLNNTQNLSYFIFSVDFFEKKISMKFMFLNSYKIDVYISAIISSYIRNLLVI